MNLGIIGTHGIPAKYGGFETFAQEVSTLLHKEGYNVTVYCNKSDQLSPPISYKGVALVYLPFSKTSNPVNYYLFSLIKSLKKEDIILVTGTGGALFYFLNIFFRKIIITNTDGIESRRTKWSPFKRRIIKLTEYLAVKNSTHLIADSKAIKKYLCQKYPKISQAKLSTIEYGAYVNDKFNQNILDKYNLIINDYFLVVCRLEPENNIKMIIDGYNMSYSSKSLIIVGNILSNDFSKLLLKEQSDKIRFIGGIYDSEELNTIRYSAFAYIHGHSVGGTNPSLLEALGNSNIAICHDNPYNREVTNNTQLYFSNANELKLTIEKLVNYESKQLKNLRESARNQIISYYNWKNISTKYLSLLKEYETISS